MIKYICGIRPALILEGYEWSPSTHPLIQTAIRRLKMRYSTASITQKCPCPFTCSFKCVNVCMDGLCFASYTSTILFGHLLLVLPLRLPTQRWILHPTKCSKADSSCLYLRHNKRAVRVHRGTLTGYAQKGLISIPAIAAIHTDRFVLILSISPVHLSASQYRYLYLFKIWYSNIVHLVVKLTSWLNHY